MPDDKPKKKKIVKTKKVSLPPKAKPTKPKPVIPVYTPPSIFRFLNDNTELSFVEKLPINLAAYRTEALYVYRWTKAKTKSGLTIPMPKADVEKMIRQARFGDIEVIYETEKTKENAQ